MEIKDFIKNPKWGVCVYKVPYVEKGKIVSPGIIIFNKGFIYSNPKRKDRTNRDSYKRVFNLDNNLWIKGVYNSGSLGWIKGKKERWRMYHETAVEDWEKFDFAMPFKDKIADIFPIPLSLCSFINPKSFFPNKKKEFDLCLVDTFSYKYKTQLILAQSIKKFEKKYGKKLSIYMFAEMSPRSKGYHRKLIKFLKDNSIKYKIGYFPEEKFITEMNKCRINLTLKQHHGSPRSVTESASCGLPQIITDGFNKFVASHFFENMLKYKTGVTFKHNNANDLCEKIKFVLDNYDSFNPREYILKEENFIVSQKKLQAYFKKLFLSRGLDYKYKRNHIFKFGKGAGTSLESFYNADLRDVERITKQIKWT